MEFTNPIALWGLSALAIPVAIHLLSLKEGQVIRIGSLRHLEETNTRQFRGIRLNEYLLLILRMLLILWLVAFLSGFHTNTSSVQNTKWVVIERGLENDNDFKQLLDSLQHDNYEVRYLAENFPLVSATTAAVPGDYWKLIEELTSRSLHDVVIITFNRMASFRGQRISVPDNMRWISKPTTSHEFIINAIQTAHDSVWVRTGKSDAEKTFFETKYQSPDQIQAIPPDTLSVIVAHTKAFDHDAKIMLAALRTIDAAIPHQLNIKTIQPDQFTEKDQNNWLIWLGEEDAPPNLNGNLIFFHRKESDFLLTSVANKQWMLTCRLNEAVAIEKNLTLELATILFPARQEWKNAAAQDRRIFPEEWLHSYAGAASATEKISDHNPTWEKVWLAFILVTLVTERLLAYKKNQ